MPRDIPKEIRETWGADVFGFFDLFWRFWQCGQIIEGLGRVFACFTCVALSVFVISV